MESRQAQSLSMGNLLPGPSYGESKFVLYLALCVRAGAGGENLLGRWLRKLGDNQLDTRRIPTVSMINFNDGNWPRFDQVGRCSAPFVPHRT